MVGVVGYGCPYYLVTANIYIESRLRLQFVYSENIRRHYMSSDGWYRS